MITEEKILKLFKNTFEESNLDYDVSEIHFEYKGVFTIKFYIEKHGGIMGTYDYEGLKDNLIDIRDKILKNPLTCPICKSTDIKNDICLCRAKFIRSNSYTGNERTINSFNHFDYFINDINKKTNISKDIISAFIENGGNISGILSGCAVIYEGLNKFPIFVLSNKIFLNSSIDKEDKLLLFFCSLIEENNFDYYNDYSSYEKKTETYFKLIGNSEVILRFQNMFSPVIEILMPFDCNDLINLYLKNKNLSEEYLIEHEIKYELKDWILNNHIDEPYLEDFNYEEYILHEIKLSDNIETFEEFKKLINNSIVEEIKRFETNKENASKDINNFKYLEIE